MMKNDYGINLSNRFEITSNNMQDQGLNHVFHYIVNTLNGQIYVNTKKPIGYKHC